MTSIVLWIAAVMVFWGGWPLVARVAGENGMTGAFVLSVFSLATVTAGFYVSGFVPPNVYTVGVLGVAGILMGLGLVAFNAACTSPLVEVSTVIPIIDTGVLLVSVIGGIIFFGESVTPRKVVAMVLLVSGILMLGPSLSANTPP